ncbi:unnamed protein product [Linum tenue]|uniref:Cytochrome P450 n=1 Tax=Linum tenue TaxID=586396 RepID=A0AAV0R8P6_9ROSI|nr:unnamed protein product [Linum tenue]
MEFLLNCLLCLIFTVTILRLLLSRNHSNQTPAAKLPPGPTRLPIIGNIHNLDANPHKSLADLAKLHGPLMSIKLGKVTTIVASSPAAAREILQKHDKLLSDRYVTLAMEVVDHHNFSLPLLPAEAKWRNLRKVCNSCIFATQKLDSYRELRREKVLELLEAVRRNASERPGEPIDVRRAVFRATLNSLSSTIISLDLGDVERSETAREFRELVRRIIEQTGKFNLGDYFPVLARMDLQGIQRRLRPNLEKVLNLFQWVVDERLEKMKSESYVPSNDMLDTLLAIGEDDDDDREGATMDPFCIKHLLWDLFVAGTDTTVSTVEWAMTELLRNPVTLAKVKEEMDQIIGKDNHLHESDIHRLPYLQAIVKETLRLHPPGPLLLPRKASADVEVCGFLVPEGAQILVNVWAIGRDSLTWDDPSSFVPERFLGSKVDVKGNNFELLPFGGGRRICPGASLALRMLHTVLGSMVHRFEWALPDGVLPEKVDMEEEFGLALQKVKPLLAVPTPRG